MPASSGARLRRVYGTVAILLLNTVVILVILNLLFAALSYGRSLVRSARSTAGLVSEHQKLMDETWTRPFAFEPFTMFREGASAGRYVNVDAHGFRRTAGQGPWPPNPRTQTTVFVFGGSTTFGYGVADDETVPSQLAQMLRVGDPTRPLKVYNFGRAYYYSTQERILFEQLVTAGVVPDLVVFIDGLNDFRYAVDEPEFSGMLQTVVDGSEGRRLPDLAIVRAAAWIAARLPGAPRPSDGDQERPNRPFPVPSLGVHTMPDRRFDDSTRGRREHRDDATVTEDILARYARSKRIIDAVAASLRVPSVSVWQPVPIYKYDLAFYQFSNLRFDKYLKPGYERMDRSERRAALGPNFCWCADVFETVRAHMYVDRFHYTPRGAELVARCIATFVEERRLLAATRR